MKSLLLPLFVASLLTGCLSPSLFPVEMPVTASLADSGGEASLLPGQPLVVRLPSNPSTGYGWTYTVVGDDVLRLDSVSGAGVESNGRVGAPGSYTLLGPPDRMKPRGASASIRSAGASQGSISQ